jgi:hypothetical protein
MPNNTASPPLKLVDAGTPNDGLPPNWQPIEESPRAVGTPTSAPSSAPLGPGPYFAASIPQAMQLTPDIMPTRYPGGLGGYRIMPPGPSGVAAVNSATKSVIEQLVVESTGGGVGALFETNGIKNQTQDTLNLVQKVGMSVSSTATGAVNLSNNPGVISTVDLVNQVAAIPTTSVALAPQQMIRVSMYLLTTKVDAGAGSVTASYTWQERFGPTHTMTTGSLALSQNTVVVSLVFCYYGYPPLGSEAQYFTTLTGSIATATYDFHMRAELMG